jgi:hypothetical protein
MDIKDDFRQKKLKIDEVSSSDYFNIIIKNILFKNDKKNDDELLLKFNSFNISFNKERILEILSDTYPVKYNLEENKINVDLKINVFFIARLLPYMLSYVNIWNYTLLIFGIFQQRMMYNYKKGRSELNRMNFEKEILDYFEKNRIKNKTKQNNNEKNNDINGNNKLSIEINIKAINIYFEIIKQKIKALMTINKIQLKLFMNNDKQEIEFNINKIESKEFKTCINEINLGLKRNKIKDNLSKSIKSSSRSQKMANFKSYMIVPEQTMEIYIENILRLKQRKEILNNKLNKKSNSFSTDLNISINDIHLEPLESIIYINDIYNVITKEEICKNTSNNFKKSTNTYMSISSIKSENSNKNEIVETLMDQNRKSKSKMSNKEPLFKINFSISLIKCIINDDKNDRSIEVNIKDFNFKNTKLSLEKIEFLIYYEPEDFGDKVKVDLGCINEINLEIVEKINYNISYHIIIDEMIFSFCKDSFLYIQEVLDNISIIMSNCFIQAKKSNKIVITKANEKVLSTYDIDENQNEQESRVFGNNVAKSICLISGQNEFKLDIDEDYLDNLRNEKEEPNEIIDDIYKSALRERIN